MKRITLLTVLGLFLFQSFCYALESSQFIEWLRQYSTIATPTIPAAVATKARGYQYVFIKGFLSEGMPCGYFEDNIAALKALGVSKDNISVIAPCSGKSLEDNQIAMSREVIFLHELVDLVFWSLFSNSCVSVLLHKLVDGIFFCGGVHGCGDFPLLRRALFVYDETLVHQVMMLFA